VHTGSFEAGADGDFAAGFDDAGRSAEAPGVEGRVVHSVAVVLDVSGALSGVVADGSVRGQSGKQDVQVTLIEFVMAGLGPLLGDGAAGAPDGIGDVAEVLLDVKTIDDLGGIRDLGVGDVPDPGCAVPRTTWC
jgi:hypothetical protein